jgi:DNA-binding MarR family transcriptional regulator
METNTDPIREAHTQWIRHGWADAADGMALVTSVVRVQQLLMERIDEELRPFGLSFARYEVLRLLSFVRTGSLPMTRLGSLLQVHATSVTSAVERLVRQGYVERLRRDADRRMVLASITAEGRRVVEEATAKLNTNVFARPGVSADHMTQLIELLGQLRASAGDHVADLGRVGEERRWMGSQ